MATVKPGRPGGCSRRGVLRVGCLTLGVVALAGGGYGLKMWNDLQTEHAEARNVSLNGVDFSRLKDGTYHGAYEGGMFKWRANECEVTVSGGKVTAIKLGGSIDPAASRFDYDTLYGRVIAAQSLQVDTISSATLTSKAYLKCIEQALIPAQK